MYNKKYEV